jgi:hypothetical protein
MTAETLPLLTETERRTLARYIERLRERLGPLPLGLRVLGSVAPGESGPRACRFAPVWTCSSSSATSSGMHPVRRIPDGTARRRPSHYADPRPRGSRKTRPMECPVRGVNRDIGRSRSGGVSNCRTQLLAGSRCGRIPGVSQRILRSRVTAAPVNERSEAAAVDVGRDGSASALRSASGQEAG